VLWRIVLFGGLAVAAAKLFFPARWRELGQRLDRVVNATLIAIALVYTLQILWLWLHR
jgi:hypothetical protein